MEEKLVKKSIFKQPQERVVYNFFEEKQIFNDMWNIYRAEYETRIEKSTELISNSEKEIFTCELEMPMLDVNEKFFIEELNKTVIIRSRIRTSKENVCYYVYPEMIEDEITIESKKKAEQLQNKYNRLNEEIEKLSNKNNELIGFKSKVKSNFWYRFMKNKIEIDSK